jgi:L-alanine-DL-glutamate epimerase-like enolase superfamily enzyme
MTTTIASVTVSVRRFPLPEPESDGTLTWDATTAVIVSLEAGGHTGLGWTYSSPAAAVIIAEHFADILDERDAFDISGGWQAMHRAGRNFGTRGLFMQALSAVDIAWWDLKARLLGVSLVDLFGASRDRVPIYGSGGFTNLAAGQLEEQVAWWQSVGCTAMKIKIGEAWGSRADRDLERVGQLRQLAGADAQLMVDANGGYTVAQARRVGARLDDLGVAWFEEPVSSDDVAGLAAVRATVRCDVAAGEYAADDYEVGRLLPVVDCLQLDATRCGGYTGFLAGAAQARAHNLPVSAHCAPALHTPVAAAVSNLRHVEWFADHARLESQLVAGAPEPIDGRLPVNRHDPGHGMSLRRAAA